MSNLRRSELDTRFVTIMEWAAVGLDMAAPLVGFAASGEPLAWFGSDWTPGQNTQQQLDATKPNYGLYYRPHRILIGPGDGAALALTPGRWLVWRRLTDTPEIPTGVVSGTLTIF